MSGSRNQLESLDFHYRTSGILCPLSPLGPSSGHLEPGFWIYVSLSLCARDSVFDDLGTWILDADHGRLVILEFGSWIFLEGILGARVILDLGSWIFRFQIPDSGTVLESGIGSGHEFCSR